MDDPTRHSELPCDLVSEVLSWLPLKYVLQCKLLSKFWYDQITRNLSFAQRRRLPCRSTHAGSPGLLFCVRETSKHQVEVLFLYPDEKGENFSTGHSFSVTNVFGVSQVVDGLVIFSRMDRIAMLCNLYTRECLNLPDFDFEDSQTLSVNFLIGRVFSNTGSNFKVVRIREVHIEKRSEIRYEVYTYGSSTWRRVHPLPSVLHCFPSSSVSVNGIIYHYLDDKILAFDLRDEKFHIILLPRNINFNRKTTVLTRVDGSVALMGWKMCSRDMVITLLKLKDFRNRRKKWLNESIVLPCGIAGIARPRPVGTVCIDEFLIRDDINPSFFFYNRGRGSFRAVNLPMNCEIIRGVSYDENFMPLRSS
ncbi:hypothetical protein L6164_026655 [Bauhinia variegata]|nr:hypothetical protein L6164_026655 [Bauhinia variegata]